jgi:hypothetical protein
MTSHPGLKQFLGKWRVALRENQTDRAYWEGQKAFEDLKSTEHLDNVRITEPAGPGLYEGGEADYIAVQAIPKMCGILQAYRENIKRVRFLVDRQKDQEDWLRQRAAAFRKKSKVASDPEFARELIRIAKRIDQGRRGTLSQLRIYLNEDRNWVPLKGYGRIRQERQLDSWFVVHLAGVFRFFMPLPGIPIKGTQREEGGGPSLRTIARLIVLFLVCADVAELREGVAVYLKHNGKRVTVANVLQQLRRAKVDTRAKQKD